MRSERKHAGDRGKRPAAFYDRHDASRRARLSVPRRDFTFRGRVSAFVLAAATWKSRTPLLLVAVAAELQLYDFAPLRGTRPVPRAAAVAARKHRRRKTPDRRCNSEDTLPVDGAGAAREKWPATSLAPSVFAELTTADLEIAYLTCERPRYELGISSFLRSH